MATLKKTKLDAVIAHLNDGGSDDFESIANITDVEDEETVESYLRKAKKDIAAAAPAPAVVKVETPEPIVYQFKDASNVIHDLEIVRQKGNRLILALPVVRDIVTVLIKGEEEIVDLEELRKLGPNELRFGVRVSALIAAAELSKS